MAGPTDKTMYPYVSFKTLRGFLERLHEDGVPPQIDRTVMGGISGQGQAEILGALRFLGLIDMSGAVQPAFRELVQGIGTSKWSERLRPVMERSYATVLKSLDIATGTRKQLEDALRAVEVADGDMLDKSARFLIRGLEESGLTVSNYFKVRRPSRPSARGRKSKAAPDGEGSDGRRSEDPAILFPDPPDMHRQPVYIPGKATGYILFSPDISESDCEMYEAAVAVVRAYAKSRGAKGRGDA